MPQRRHIVGEVGINENVTAQPLDLDLGGTASCRRVNHVVDDSDVRTQKPSGPISAIPNIAETEEVQCLR